MLVEKVGPGDVAQWWWIVARAVHLRMTPSSDLPAQESEVDAMVPSMVARKVGADDVAQWWALAIIDALQMDLGDDGIA